MLPYKFGPKEALHFPARCAQVCSQWNRNGATATTRALDIGCAVGGSTFELTRYFDNVVGVDFSQHFIDAAIEMKEKGSMNYDILKQGTVFEKHLATLPTGVNPVRAEFSQGDACNLDPELGIGKLYDDLELLITHFRYV